MHVGCGVKWNIITRKASPVKSELGHHSTKRSAGSAVAQRVAGELGGRRLNGFVGLS